RLPKDAFISVNVSPETAGSEELREVLASVDPSRVVLEITENAAAGDYEEVSEAVGALRAIGVRIALDDTGSGTVSFNSLFDVHADIITIEIDLTHGIASDPIQDKTAPALAELIQTATELNLPRGVGLLVGQCFPLCPPQPAAASSWDDHAGRTIPRHP